MRAPLDPDLFTDCSAEAAPMRVGAKWTAKIITCLRDGPRRFSELQVPLRGITPKVPTESLRALERDGMVARIERPGIPAHVEYELTALGHSLFGPMEAQCEWSRRHLGEVLEARENALVSGSPAHGG